MIKLAAIKNDFVEKSWSAYLQRA